MSIAEPLILEAPPQAPGMGPSSASTLRILFIVESAAGGTGRHVLDLSEGMIARGCEVHLVYSTGRVDRMFLERLAAIPAVKCLALPMRTAPHPNDIGVVRKIRRYMREFGPFEAVHGHSSKGGALARLVAFGTGVKAYYTLHGLIMMDPCLPRWKWFMYWSIELAMSLRTARIIAVSPEESRAAARLGFGRARLVTVPNGVGALKLTPRIEARKTLGVADQDIVIGFVGRLVEQKAPHVLIESFAAAVKANPRARLAIVGAGPLEQEMRDLADRLGVAEKIIWLGERDARQVFAAFDLFALSSRKEGLPYVILEAMAVGLPVVATTSSGVEILIEPGVTGEVVPTDDIAGFSKALVNLTTDPALLARQSAAAAKRAELFTIDAMVDGTLAVYRNADSPHASRNMESNCNLAGTTA